MFNIYQPVDPGLLLPPDVPELPPDLVLCTLPQGAGHHQVDVGRARVQRAHEAAVLEDAHNDLGVAVVHLAAVDVVVD